MSAVAFNEVFDAEPTAIDRALIARADVLLSSIHYLDHVFTVRAGHGGVFLQATYWEKDAIDPVQIEPQATRKWLLSPAMTDSEIVLTAFKCCLTSAEHRCREAFHYKGARICSPHFDVEDLVRLCQTEGRADAGAR